MKMGAGKKKGDMGTETQPQDTTSILQLMYFLLTDHTAITTKIHQ